jgi:rare lipoprotein A (peptidoglycan hydrolase)
MNFLSVTGGRVLHIGPVIRWPVFCTIVYMAQSCATFPLAVDREMQTKSTAPGESRNREGLVPGPMGTFDKSSAPTLAKTHTGKASWYGPGFDGKKTATGEIFDKREFTAAHRSLPLGSKARVTNLENGKSVDVEINDRGLLAAGRVIDLSQAAARALGIIVAGTARVKVELVADETAEKSKTK